MKAKELINHIAGEMGEDVSRNDFTLGLSRQEICILAEWYEDVIAHATEKGGIIHPATYTRAKYLRNLLKEK